MSWTDTSTIQKAPGGRYPQDHDTIRRQVANPAASFIAAFPPVASLTFECRRTGTTYMTSEITNAKKRMHIRCAGRNQRRKVSVEAAEATYYHRIRCSYPSKPIAASIHWSSCVSSTHSADPGSPGVVARNPSHARSTQASYGQHPHRS